MSEVKQKQRQDAWSRERMLRAGILRLVPVSYKVVFLFVCFQVVKGMQLRHEGVSADGNCR